MQEVHDNAKIDYIAGMKYKDIAIKYGVTINTVKSWKVRYKWSKANAPEKGKSVRKKVCTQKTVKRMQGYPVIDVPDRIEKLSVLTDKQRRFVGEYLIDCNATQAAIRAGYSENSANEQGARLLANASVKAEIDIKLNKRAHRTEITADRVLQELWAIATSDTNEIVELRRSCCRFCWGDNYKYQFTDNEMERRKEQYEAAKESAIREDKSIPEFDEAGGIGFDGTKDPNYNCPECFGEGVNTPHFKDTRKLSPGAKALYAGVKIGKGGLEVKMHSKDKALELIGKHLGMFIEKIEVKDTTDRAQSMKRARERVRNGQGK